MEADSGCKTIQEIATDRTLGGCAKQRTFRCDLNQGEPVEAAVVGGRQQNVQAGHEIPDQGVRAVCGDVG